VNASIDYRLEPQGCSAGNPTAECLSAIREATQDAQTAVQFVRTNVPFGWWDDKNHRFQDLRASYGAGFQFYFLGGLQFNWVWAKRLSYTSYPDDDILNPVKADVGGVRSEFYIAFDW